ncbi:MAG: hypothetical protein FJX29_03715 [Alphaproteobacteria bacterium]|nr:hypothetical protein [Alphaproteobacteria bacterium]
MRFKGSFTAALCCAFLMFAFAPALPPGLLPGFSTAHAQTRDLRQRPRSEPPPHAQTPQAVPLPQLTAFERARGCYASREQGYVSGRLVWRPLVVCPFNDFAR